MSIEWGVPPRRRDLILGDDLGQQHDYSALVVADRHREADPVSYDVGHIERFALGTRYPVIVEQLRARINALDVPAVERGPRPNLALVVDQTGCGRPVIDMILAADLGIPVNPVTITSGTATTQADDGWHVAKQTLASVVQVVLQSGRLRISSRLPNASELTNELRGFRAKIKLNGNVNFAAGEDWRSAPHDDLVLALALSLWWGENEPAGWADLAAETDLGAFFSFR